MEEADPVVDALRRLCESEGGYQAVADRAHVSPDNLWQILNGVKLPSGNSRGVGPRLRTKLSAAFPDWLTQRLGARGTLAATRFGTASVAAEEPPAVYSGRDDEHVIPQYAAGGAMGHGLILEEAPPGFIKGWRVDHEWLRLNVRHHTGIHNLCIVTGFGPSMRGMFNPGDPLLCDRGVKVVDVDAVYFFRIADHGFIKMLQRIPTAEGMVIRAKSKNPDYDPFDITEKMDFEVFGRILTVWKSEQL
jgi:hypothetical protein